MVSVHFTVPTPPNQKKTTITVYAVGSSFRKNSAFIRYKKIFPLFLRERKKTIIVFCCIKNIKRSVVWQKKTFQKKRKERKERKKVIYVASISCKRFLAWTAQNVPLTVVSEEFNLGEWFGKRLRKPNEPLTLHFLFPLSTLNLFYSETRLQTKK